MDSPYRSSSLPAPAQTPRDTGIVGEIIGQFADRFAFYRELIQNAIDAGTEAIDVELQHDPSAEHIQIRVRDHGEGMTREVIEDRLLVLFRSTKEHDDDKIGKFGIGFASVLAIGPRVVRVDSVRDGARNVLHLHPDLSFEIFDGGAANKTGTAVELEIPLQVDGLIEFVASSRGALETWCQHATVPIHFVHRAATGEELTRERIDRPLGLSNALIQVEAVSRDQGMRAVVGLSDDGEPYAGFFNHGLTLYESREPFLGRLSFKIQAPRLGHTLSRDNVRRDKSFERALDFARHLAENALPAAAAVALREAAERDDKARFLTLIGSLGQAGVVLDRDDVSLPLLEPIGSRRSTNASAFAKGGAWAASEPGLITAHLAKRGTPVLDLCTDAGNGTSSGLLAFVTEACGKRPRIVELELTLAIPIPGDEASDEALISELTAVLDDCYRQPAAVVIANLHGTLASEIAIAGDPDAATARGPWLADSDRAERNPFHLLRRLPLVLNARAPHVELARKRASSDAATAATLLARTILLEREVLDDRRSERMVERGLERLLGTNR